MNSTAFGPCAWNFLHQLPWNFPKEILSFDDSTLIIRFLHFIITMLPCRYCRESGGLFEKEIGLIDSVSYDIGGRTRMVTRSKVANYIYTLHNRVNNKLEKPLFGMSWRDCIRKRPDWKNSMWAFLFAVCWNFPETNPSEDIVTKYYVFFSDLLPRILQYTDVGKEYTYKLKQKPISKNSVLKNRLMLCKWIYDMRCMCGQSCGKEEWDFRDTDTLFEAFRARTPSCSSNKSMTKEEMLKPKTCQ